MTTCERCPGCALCEDVGTQWSSMLTKPGCWSAVQGEYYLCLVATQCVGYAVGAGIDDRFRLLIGADLLKLLSGSNVEAL